MGQQPTERLGSVAAPAIAAELAFVDVVGLVACNALTGRARHVLGLTMAVAAAKTRVCARQRKVGLGCMFELPEIPAVRVVAVAALLAKLILVHVLGPVTAGAFMRRLPERPRCMAFLARNADMQADQRKSRKVMVKPDLLAPAAFPVACQAIASHRALVYVVDVMAAGTVLRQFLLLEHTRVTGVAVELFMRAPKREMAALFVIE